MDYMENCQMCGRQRVTLRAIEPEVSSDERYCSPCAEKEKARIQAIWERIERLDGFTVVVSDVMMVWEFEKAPPDLQELSLDGGDEDWLVYVPHTVQFPYGTPRWIEQLSNGTDMFLLPDGSRVFIASH